MRPKPTIKRGDWRRGSTYLTTGQRNIRRSDHSAVFSNWIKTKGESCVYFGVENQDIIEHGIGVKGIDVDAEKGARSLSVYHVEESGDGKQVELSILKKMRDETKREALHPARLAGRPIGDIGTKSGMIKDLATEKFIQDRIQHLGISQMCCYDISEIEGTNRNQWISELLKNHHHVILASEPNTAVAFETSLLEVQ
jgi:hypothetical protein